MTPRTPASVRALSDAVAEHTIGAMFGRVSVSLASNRQYAAYLCDDRVEIIATIDGYTARIGSAHWTGHHLDSYSARLPTDAVRALTIALRSSTWGSA